MNPDAPQLLARVLALEARRGYDDGAVLGGLSAFAARWLNELGGAAAPEEVRAQVNALAAYAKQDRKARQAQVDALLRSVASESANGGPSPRRAGAAKPLTPERGRQDESFRPPGSATRSTAPAPRSPSSRPDASSTTPRRPANGKPTQPPTSKTAARSRTPASARPKTQSALSPSALRPDTPVGALSGVGPKGEGLLAKLGIHTLADLVYHAPHRYQDFSRLVKIADLQPGVDATVVGSVWDVRRRPGKGPLRDVLTLVLADASGTISCTFFNQPWLAKAFHQGREVVISGRPEVFQGRLALQSPAWEPADRERINTGRPVPIYPLTAGLNLPGLRRWVKAALDAGVAAQLVDPLPTARLGAYGLPSLAEALKTLHFPPSVESVAAARARLAFDELLTLQLWSRQRRLAWQSRPGISLAEGLGAIQDFTAALPFTLTAAQERSIAEIAAELATAVPMNRLLQGDVGSGKTAVAAAAATVAVHAGYQAVLMAPTEILAEQHFAGISRLLEPMGAKVARLVGSMTPKAKREMAEAVAAAEVDLLVGTHAVIQDTVAFERLGLVIVDEQHRFGVLQRAELPRRMADGLTPHVLVMTATPIPRTLAMVLSADLDQSVLDELPPGRKPIATRWLGGEERDRAYAFVRARVERGEQAYFVYPLIEEAEGMTARAATSEFERLQIEVFPDLTLGLLHGKLRPKEKDEVMGRFYRGEVQVLVATTVIEVGVDVPNATVMLIESANRFGLAQLHQLRGRVGRGAVESVCLLVTDDVSPIASERLKVMTETTDGLRLAEYDLKLRGPGDYFGIQQSGVSDRFRFARDASPETLQLAARVAGEVMKADPQLADPSHAELARRVGQLTAAAEQT